MADASIRSILTELDNALLGKNKDQIISSRANHIIASTINLFKQINENYDAEAADDLMKRFYSSIRNEDPKRFERGIKKITESKNAKH